MNPTRLLDAEATALPSANLYTDADFLEVIAEVYHPGKACRIRDYAIQGRVFRLLHVEGAGPSLQQTFVDLHESIGVADAALRLPSIPRLPGVAGSPEPAQAFQSRVEPVACEGAPAVLWRSFATWADFLALVHSRSLVAEDMRRGRRLLERFPDLQFSVDDVAPDVLPTACAWKSQRDHALSRTDLFADDRNRRFFEALKARGLLRASTLRGDGKLLAVWLGAAHRGRWSGWVFAFNPDRALARYSLGQQLVYRMLEHGHAEGHAEFDFSIGMEPYKLKFATHVRPISMAGRPPLDARAAEAMRHWLRQHPRLRDAARAMRRRLSPLPAGPSIGA